MWLLYKEATKTQEVFGNKYGYSKIDKMKNLMW